MSEKILFRGMQAHNGEWIEGFVVEHEPPLSCIVPEGYVKPKSKWFIIKTGFADWGLERPLEGAIVHADTVGRFYGALGDVRIFEHDKLKVIFHDGASFEEAAFAEGAEFEGVVRFRDGCFSVVHEDKTSIPLFYLTQIDGCQILVTGNIHNEETAQL